MKLTTTELLALAKAHPGEPIEVRLPLNGGCFTTHYVEWYNGRFYDTGCDDIRCRTSARSMQQFYPDTLGKIWWLMEMNAVNIHRECPA